MRGRGGEDVGIVKFGGVRRCMVYNSFSRHTIPHNVFNQYKRVYYNIGYLVQQSARLFNLI